MKLGDKIKIKKGVAKDWCRRNQQYHKGVTTAGAVSGLEDMIKLATLGKTGFIDYIDNENHCVRAVFVVNNELAWWFYSTQIELIE